MRWWLGLLVVLSACGAEQAREQPGSSTTAVESSPVGRGAEDVELVECGTDPARPEVTVRVMNRSSERSNYMVKVGFQSPDGAEQYDSTLVMVSGLQPAQGATKSAGSFHDLPGPFDCVVLDVTRFSDE